MKKEIKQIKTMDNKSIWVFGYGSLIWNPGFQFKKCVVGHIKGYVRRFYQGSDQHRGSFQNLGRVATLIPDPYGETWGIAFLIEDHDTALSYLKQRESSIGGYTTIVTDFYPQTETSETSIPSFDTLVYIALPENRLFLGPSPMKQIAREIAFAKGICGYNVEYLAKLQAFMKIELPQVQDDHLNELEEIVKSILKKENPKRLNLFTDALKSWLYDNLLFNKRSRNKIVIENSKYECYDDSNEIKETGLEGWLLNPFLEDNFKFIETLQKKPLRCIS